MEFIFIRTFFSRYILVVVILIFINNKLNEYYNMKS